MRKPDPDSFRMILSENNLNPDETLFIDDSLKHVEGARLAGLHAIHLTEDRSLLNIENDIQEINRLEQLEQEKDICKRIDALKTVTMFGRRLNNPDGLRKHYDIHPYTKQGTGVSVTITYTDDETGIIHILHAKKKNRLNYDQIGGYTRGQGPEGSEVNYDKRTEDKRDKDEEEFIGNFDAITISDEGEMVTFEPKSTYSLKQLKECAHQGFLDQQSKKLIL